MNIGILDQTCQGWSAGASYTKMMLASLELVLPEAPGKVVFLTQDGNLEPPSGIEKQLVPESATPADWQSCLSENQIAVTLPVRDHLIHDIPGAKVGWIPDFQHFQLPDLFTGEDRDARNELLEAVAAQSDRVIVSSESARADFQHFLSDHGGKACVARFSSMLWQSGYRDLVDVEGRYHLPSRFFLVANQFWKHKNHAILPAAVAEARRSGADVFLVCTGLPCDYRDPENRVFSEFLQACSREGVRDFIAVLGQTPYADLVTLMRKAVAIIQPSRFEGWSTSIEDCKAIGRPLICSDIPVHREQVGSKGLFFPVDDPAELGRALALASRDWILGPELDVEAVSLAAAKDRCREFGRVLLDVSKEAVEAHRHNPTSSTPERVRGASVSVLRQQAEYIQELETACAQRLEGMHALQAETNRLQSELDRIQRHPFRNAIQSLTVRKG